MVNNTVLNLMQKQTSYNSEFYLQMNDAVAWSKIIELELHQLFGEVHSDPIINETRMVMKWAFWCVVQSAEVATRTDILFCLVFCNISVLVSEPDPSH